MFCLISYLEIEYEYVRENPNHLILRRAMSPVI